LIKNAIQINYFNRLSNAVYSCDGKAEFSASLLQSSVLHDPSEIILIRWFGAQKEENSPNRTLL